MATLITYTNVDSFSYIIIEIGCMLSKKEKKSHVCCIYRASHHSSSCYTHRIPVKKNDGIPNHAAIDASTARQSERKDVYIHRYSFHSKTNFAIL
jgi:hypothetical protein